MFQQVRPSRAGAASHFTRLDQRYEAEFDAQDACDEYEREEATRLSAEFIAALPLGEDAKFDDTTVGDALYGLACSSYAQLLTDIVIAAADSEDAALVALIKRLGDGYADIVLTQKEGVAA